MSAGGLTCGLGSPHTSAVTIPASSVGEPEQEKQ